MTYKKPEDSVGLSQSTGVSSFQQKWMEKSPHSPVLPSLHEAERRDKWSTSWRLEPVASQKSPGGAHLEVRGSIVEGSSTEVESGMGTN
jgi:hypothetical protein